MDGGAGAENGASLRDTWEGKSAEVGDGSSRGLGKSSVEGDF